ncbi:MAG: nucleoside monophosphate kinase [Alphaproteobacteria bacterium]|nr:nucleoside monophosphate kinase [Alphaproteobacteria bacterium]
MHKIILMMGGQGVGKGTLSRMLGAGGDYKYIETGEMLRRVGQNTPVGRMIARGELIPDDEMFNMIAGQIECGRNVIIDGFPRNMPQAQWLVEKYSDKFDVCVLYIAVSRDIMMARIQRRINAGAGRADDADAAAVQRRLRTFFDVTMPAIEWMRTARGVRFYEIDGSGTIDENYDRMMTALGKDD